MKEMKKSADMKVGEGHLKEVLSCVKKEEPIEPTTTTDTKFSSMDTNSPSAVASATVTADASPPNLEERAATLRSSKEEHIVENSLAGSKKESQKEVMVTKDKETNTGPYLSSPKVADPYTILWQDAAKFWNDFFYWIC